MISINDCKNNGVTISLLLTRKCNMECPHCGYDCGPEVRSGYMGFDILNKVRHQVSWLQDRHIGVSINLIGGEPTLNLNKFSQILREVNFWETQIEMTTNGWWLARKSTLRRFMEICRPYVTDGTCNDGFTVRISGDQFHEYSRQDTWMEKILLKDISRLFEEGYDYVGEDFELPRYNANAPWIYVDKTLTYDGVVPLGRGTSFGGHEHKCKENDHYSLSYLPNGKLMDICCKFSLCEFGTVDDNPLVLLNLADRFLRDMTPSCGECRDKAAEWKRKGNVARNRKAFYTQLEKWESEDSED